MRRAYLGVTMAPTITSPNQLDQIQGTWEAFERNDIAGLLQLGK